MNLTSSTDYLRESGIQLAPRAILTHATDGVADVVLWGYAENGAGVIVGCVATLRPLLQRVLRLSGSGSGAVPYRSPHAKLLAVKSRLNGRDEEWVALEDQKTANTMHQQGSSVDSEEHVLAGKEFHDMREMYEVERRSSSVKDSMQQQE